MFKYSLLEVFSTSALHRAVLCTFTRHKFLLITVKEWLKSVLNYRSYPKNKNGYPFFDHPVLTRSSNEVFFILVSHFKRPYSIPSAIKLF